MALEQELYARRILDAELRSALAVPLVRLVYGARSSFQTTLKHTVPGATRREI